MMKITGACKSISLIAFALIIPIRANAGESILGTMFCKLTTFQICESEFGTEIGRINGVTAYSNCNEKCIIPLPHKQIFHSLGTDYELQTGLTWQCVEYARRYWITVKKVKFGDVRTANNIWELTKAQKIEDGSETSLIKFENRGLNTPRTNDLIIFDKVPRSKFYLHGHVAVVTDSSRIDAGFLAIAEQNFSNGLWKGKDYSRELKVEVSNGQFNVIDSENQDAKILGWMRPAP